MSRKSGRLFLVGAAALAAAAGVGTSYFHDHQVRRLAPQWREAADHAESEGRTNDAISFLGYYTAQAPDDRDARLRYGRLLTRPGATTSERDQGLAVLDALAPDLPEGEHVRNEVIRLARETGRWGIARRHLEFLVTRDGATPEHHAQYAECLVEDRQYAKAAASYEKAAALAPREASYALHLAELLEHRLAEPDRALAVLEKLVGSAEGDHRGFVARARFLARHERVEEAAHDLAKASALAPDEPAVALAAAELARQTGDPTGARSRLERLLQAKPKEARLRIELADLEVEAGRLDVANECLRRGLEASPNDLNLLEHHVDLLLRQGQTTPAKEAVARLKSAGAPEPLVHYWEARLLLQGQRWTEAARLLEAVERRGGGGDWLARVALTQAEAHRQLGDADRYLAAVERAASRNAASLGLRQELAGALLRVGRVDEAAAEYDRLVNLPGATQARWLGLARALLAQTLRRPTRQRDWVAVTHAIDEAARKPTDPVPVDLVRAESLAAQGRFDRAIQVVAAARERHPDRLELAAAHADLALAQGNAGEADRLLTAAVRTFGDRPELRAVRLRHLLKTGAGAAERNRLVEATPVEERPALFAELARALHQRGDLAGAAQERLRLAQERPEDRTNWIGLLELYLASGRESSAAEVVARLRQLDGEEGESGRLGEAMLLLERARRGQTGLLPRARVLLAQVEATRPRLPRVPLLLATAEEVEGRTDRAIELYQRALDLGERNPGVIERLAQLQRQQYRVAAADQLYRLLEEGGPLTGPQAMAAADVAQAHGDLDRAAVLARTAVAADSAVARDQLWACRILEADGRLDEAGKRLEAALRRQPEAPELWTALVWNLTRRGQKSTAASVLEQAGRRLQRSDITLLLAEGHQALGETRAAEDYFRLLLQARPDDVEVNRKAAAFSLQQGQAERAEALLRKVLAPGAAIAEEDAFWARRELAGLVARRGEAGFGEALALLERNLARFSASIPDQRAKARLLATQPPRRSEAAKLLEASAEREPLPPEDRFLLAQLHDATDNRSRAKEHLMILASAPQPAADHLAYLVRGLVRAGEGEEAARWLGELERVEPDSARTREIKQEVAKVTPANPGS